MSAAAATKKKSDIDFGQQFARFAAICDKDKKIKPEMKRWIEHLVGQKESTKYLKTSSKGTHVCIEAPSDLRLVIPKSKEFSKKKDGAGLRHLLTEAGFDKNKERITLTWAVCYVNDIAPDQSAANWKNFECSHRCIEKDVAEGYRCIDPKCLVWESKSDNQDRANAGCRKQCSHNCGKIICQCNNVHNPVCL